MLDPTYVNPLVDVKTFQYILKSWITKMTPHLEDSISQLYESFSSKVDTQPGIFHVSNEISTDHHCLFKTLVAGSDETFDVAFHSEKLLTR